MSKRKLAGRKASGNMKPIRPVQVYLSTQCHGWLRKHAVAEGISMSEVVRVAIERYKEGH